MITQATTRGQLTGFQVSHGAPSITHMLFADDSLLFCKATVQECNILLGILNQYKEFSGQEVNFYKLVITFTKGISPDLKQYILQTTRIQKVGGFGKYLDLPKYIGRNMSDTFSYIL